MFLKFLRSFIVHSVCFIRDSVEVSGILETAWYFRSRTLICKNCGVLWRFVNINVFCWEIVKKYKGHTKGKSGWNFRNFHGQVMSQFHKQSASSSFYPQGLEEKVAKVQECYWLKRKMAAFVSQGGVSICWQFKAGA